MYTLGDSIFGSIKGASIPKGELWGGPKMAKVLHCSFLLLRWGVEGGMRDAPG